MRPDDANDELFLRIADRLKALSDPTRLKILHALEDGERTVTEILEVVGGSQANVSKHLSRMRLAGIVASRREGTCVHYRVVDPAAFVICRTVCDALERRADDEHRTILRARAAQQGDR
ncbi:MAG TPA: metalloregulator ArsR/SmtB family transcription factor [Thermoanaerobaculia bacterium]|nr:metalloregulator ArsR/SmtB family transcription factor [Thermoanaerobaculia bacterium]